MKSRLETDFAAVVLSLARLVRNIFCSISSMISCELDKNLSTSEKKDCFQNNLCHAAKCYWSGDVISVSSLVLLVS